MSEQGPVFKRVLLKVSGEMLAGGESSGIQPDVLRRVAAEIQSLRDLGVQVAIVLGGGNIFRGISGAARGMDRVRGDQMGMLATLINALALQDALESLGCPARVLSSVGMEPIAERFTRDKAVASLDAGAVVIFGGGTGNPFFSTDTASALRAAEIGADVLIKGTKVDGVYDKDPERHPDARRYSTLTHLDVVQKGLRVMDLTAASLCMENRIPILVFNMKVPGNLLKAIQGEAIGTRVG